MTGSKGLPQVLLSRPVFTTSGLLSGAVVYVCVRTHIGVYVCVIYVYIYVSLSLPFGVHATRTTVTPFDVAEGRLSILAASLLPDFRIKKCRQRHNRGEPLSLFLIFSWWIEYLFVSIFNFYFLYNKYIFFFFER